MRPARSIRRILRVLWVTLGLGFTAWLIIGFQANPLAPGTFDSTSAISVRQDEQGFSFEPVASTTQVKLLFLPGGMVDPDAYAPLLRSIAERGFAARLMRLPLRCACTSAQTAELFARIRDVLRDEGKFQWVLAGHSRGAMLASTYVHQTDMLPAGLVLMGTTHPRDFSLREYEGRVLKLYGTRDGIASLRKMEENRPLLPSTTRWIAIEGGNHVQFGDYRYQLGDGKAEITREQQQRQVRDAIVELLASLNVTSR